MAKLEWVEVDKGLRSTCNRYRVFELATLKLLYNRQDTHLFFHSSHQTIEEAKEAAQKEEEELYTW